MLNDKTLLDKFNVGFKEPDNINHWQKLTDYCNKMSVDQQIFVNSQEPVLTARQQLMEAFSMFLFEKYKNEFYQVGGFQQLCDTYIEIVINTGLSYAERAAGAIDENAKLKARIAELEGKLNGQ